MMFRVVYLLIALFERSIGCLRLSKFQLNIKHVYAHTKGEHSWTNWCSAKVAAVSSIASCQIQKQSSSKRLT